MEAHLAKPAIARSICLTLLFGFSALSCGGEAVSDESGSKHAGAAGAAHAGTTGRGGSSGGAGATGSGGLPEPLEHRPERITCDDLRETADLPISMPGDCTAHEDCTQGRNGRCTPMLGGGACTYDECFEDADCGSQQVCRCDGGRFGNNACSIGDCAVDSDCGPGGWCSPTLSDCGKYFGIKGYYCRTAADECLNDSDCTEQAEGWLGLPGYCAYSPEARHWVCRYTHCVE